MTEHERTSIFSIEGMHCASCVSRIETAVGKLPDVEKVNVNLASGKAYVSGPADPGAVIRAIQDQGYQAVSRTEETSENEPACHETSPEGAEKRKFAVSLLFTLPVFVLSMGGFDFAGINWLLLLLTTPVVTYGGRDFFITTFRLLKHGQTNMDTLIALGTGIAYVYSAIAVVFALGGHLYFEAAAMITTIILLGRWLEVRARQKSGRAIEELVRLQPKNALVLVDGEYEVRPADRIRPGDQLLIKPGAGIPADGVIVEGHGAVDESMMTGESMPVEKHPGDTVIGGTMNMTGSFAIRAEKTGKDTALSAMIRLVDEAQGTKPAVQRLADKVAGIFVPIVLVLAAITFGGWLITGAALSVAIKPAVAVLVIACPCALGLATPVAIQAVIGHAARRGILVRNAGALEIANQIDTLALDKTGTLTMGKPQVTHFVKTSRYSDAELIGWVASLESRSEHPLADAVVCFAESHEMPVAGSVADFESVAGEGVRGSVDGHRLVIGKQAFLEDNGIHTGALQAEADRFAAEGGSLLWVGVDNALAGVITARDELKVSALAAVRQLKELEIAPVMLTGDVSATARQIAAEAGISRVRAGLSPADKRDYIRQEQAGRRNGKPRRIGMVGDGINDAPALAQADLGLAVGTGTDVAIASADMTLVHGDLARAVEAIQLGRRTMTIIRQNLFWAFFYNLLLVPAAALGVVHPMWAAAAMSLSSLTVVLNSLRLR